MNRIDIINKQIMNIDSKICGIINDYIVLKDSQKVADYVIQFLRTYLEHIAARIYAGENPHEEVRVRGKDKWYTKYMKFLKENNEYGYIWRMHASLQITTSHYVPENDGAIRLMEGYLSKLYQLRDQMRNKFELEILHNLELYPQQIISELDPFYEDIYEAIRKIRLDGQTEHTNDRYYITRKKYRSVAGKGFFEYTLTYAQESNSKFDRFVAYSFNDIPNYYSIQCDFVSTTAEFKGIDIDVKCITAWNVSIRPCEMEKIAAICGHTISVKSEHSYYKELMKFLTKTSMNLLDILTSEQEEYEYHIQKMEIERKVELKKSLDKIRDVILSDKPGCNILRYVICYLRNDIIRDQLSDRDNNWISFLYIRNESLPFDEMPYASDLAGHKVLKSSLRRCIDLPDDEYQMVAALVNKEAYDSNMLYVPIDGKEIDYYKYEVGIFNEKLPNTRKQQRRRINTFANHLYVENYYELTKKVIEKLQGFSEEGVDGYSEIVEDSDILSEMDDEDKKIIVSDIFKKSSLGMIYGAAGTGKTRVAEYIARLFKGNNILLLANTNAAKNNLKRRITSDNECQTIYDYLHNGYDGKQYDLVIVDECSTVCNEDILRLFEKCMAKAYLLLGDIYQIEAIKFGNWFNFARYFVDKKSVYELSTPYRARDKKILVDMWDYVRKFDSNMFDRLQANGFISSLDESIFQSDGDEIILCLGYDGLYGINNINRYMQKVNKSEPIVWGNWVYKVGDKILFNENRRFGNVLYNNLKGVIVAIEKKPEEIVFQIKVDRIITNFEALSSGLQLMDCEDDGKSIVEFSVKKRIERDADKDYSEETVPFQIAYAVSIHKAQGLEYSSVKVIITEDVDERISHNIFYTAITRTTDKLKIYMSKDTQIRLSEKFVESNIGLQQVQLFAGHASLKVKNKLSS